MPDLILAMQNLIASGEITFAARDAAVVLAAEQAKATPSRGQIAAMVMAGIGANSVLEMSPGASAEWAVKCADALLAELAKSSEASR